MKKCFICTICSWIVGLSTLWLVGMGLGGWPLPAGGWINICYAVLGLIALGFLYYQLVPCPRCVARQDKGQEKEKAKEKEVRQAQEKTAVTTKEPVATYMTIPKAPKPVEHDDDMDE